MSGERQPTVTQKNVSSVVFAWKLLGISVPLLCLAHLTAADFNRFGVLEKDGPLYPIKQGGKYGYIDKAGHVIVEPLSIEQQLFTKGLRLFSSQKELGTSIRAGELRLSRNSKVEVTFPRGMQPCDPEVNGATLTRLGEFGLPQGSKPRKHFITV